MQGGSGNYYSKYNFTSVIMINKSAILDQRSVSCSGALREIHLRVTSDSMMKSLRGALTAGSKVEVHQRARLVDCLSVLKDADFQTTWYTIRMCNWHALYS